MPSQYYNPISLNLQQSLICSSQVHTHDRSKKQLSVFVQYTILPVSQQEHLSLHTPTRSTNPLDQTRTSPRHSISTSRDHGTSVWTMDKMGFYMMTCCNAIGQSPVWGCPRESRQQEGNDDRHFVEYIEVSSEVPRTHIYNIQVVKCR